MIFIIQEISRKVEVYYACSSVRIKLADLRLAALSADDNLSCLMKCS